MTAIITDPRTPIGEAQIGSLEFLDARTIEYVARYSAWRRDEARLMGGDAILHELTKWKGESDGIDGAYTARLRQAKVINFAQLHATLLSGHMERARPTPGKGFEPGPLGEIRERKQIAGKPTTGELWWYNVNGIGNDGVQFPAFASGVQARACATGHRWTLVEMPDLADVRSRSSLRIMGRAGRVGRNGASAADVMAGFRPYLVEFSPLDVPFWEVYRGQLQCAVIRTVTARSQMNYGVWEPSASRLGYYVLTAEGYTGFGDYFAQGGWWLFGNDRTLVMEGDEPMMGTWEKTLGQIPFFPLIADDADGTLDVATLNTIGQLPQGEAATFGVGGRGGAYSDYRIDLTSRSLTMELGQLQVGLMNRLSERDHNYAQACKTVKLILGVDPANPKQFNDVVTQLNAGSIVVAVPAWTDAKGTTMIPQVWDSSSALVDASAGNLIIESTLAEAKEIMLREVTGPDSSGTARKVNFATGPSPLLARMAGFREGWENNALYFTCLRAGFSDDEARQAYSQWPREIELRPIVDDIDAMFLTIARSGLESDTAAIDLLVTALEERGLLKPESRATIEAEFKASAAQRVQQMAATKQALSGVRTDLSAERQLPPEGGPGSAAA